MDDLFAAPEDDANEFIVEEYKFAHFALQIQTAYQQSGGISKQTWKASHVMADWVVSHGMQRLVDGQSHS